MGAEVVTKYGNLTLRQEGFAMAGFLLRALPNMVWERLAQQKPLGKGVGKIAKFTRYEALAAISASLGEGISPDIQEITKTDVTAVMEQWGGATSWTDVIEDMFEDNIATVERDLIAEQAALSLEMRRQNTFKAGTSVFYANGSARTDLNSVFSRGLLRKAVRTLRNNKAKFFTQMVKASPNYATAPVPMSYWAICHTDLEPDLKTLPGFTPVENYSNSDSAIPYEFGKLDNVRFITTTIAEPWLAGGAAVGDGMISAGAANNDVYPVIIVAQEFGAIIPLKGDNAVKIIALRPDQPDKSDILGQKGFVGWKAYQTCCILNNNFMARIETCATSNPN